MSLCSKVSRYHVPHLICFRLLPPVCRQIVLHVLWSHQTLKSPDLKSFCGMDDRLAPEA